MSCNDKTSRQDVATYIRFHLSRPPACLESEALAEAVTIIEQKCQVNSFHSCCFARFFFFVVFFPNFFFCFSSLLPFSQTARQDSSRRPAFAGCRKELCKIRGPSHRTPSGPCKKTVTRWLSSNLILWLRWGFCGANLTYRVSQPRLSVTQGGRRKSC